MSSGLNTIPLGQLVAAGESITYGVVKPGANPPDGVRFIRGGDIKAGRVDTNSLRRISGEVSQQYKRTLLRGGELLVSLVGNPGEVAIASPDLAGANIARQVGLVRLGPSSSAEFVKYYLMSRAGKLALGAQSLGSVQTVINLSDLKRVPVPQLPLPAQKAIAGFLSNLDDKIELNRRMNETLEAMAQAIFRDWFVDFGPVRRKLAGETDAVAIMGGLTPDPARAAELAALFPEALQDDLLPAGWEVSTVGEEFNLTMGQSPPGDTYNDAGEGLPFFQGRTDFGFRFPERRKFCSAPTRTAALDDTLISVRAPVGDLNMAWEPCCIGRGVAAARHKFGGKSYTFYAMRSLQPELESFEHTGTVFGAINKKQFERLSVVRPPSSLVKSFELLAAPLDDRIRLGVMENRTLAETRDYLLPRLMSGQVRVNPSNTESAAA